MLALMSYGGRTFHFDEPSNAPSMPSAARRLSSKCPPSELSRWRPQKGMVNIAFESRNAKPLSEPRRIDPVLHPSLKAPRHKLHTTQGIGAPRQGSRIDVLDLMIARLDAPEEVG